MAAPAADGAAPETAPTPPPGAPAAEASDKPPKRGKAKKIETPSGRLSALDAAARVLAESSEPMNCQELIGAMAAKGYWTSPNGKTPGATLYSALAREIALKGDAARFRRVGPGRFVAAGSP